MPRPQPAAATPTGSTGSTPRTKRLPPHATVKITEQRRAAAVALVEELVARRQKIIKQPDETAVAEWRRVVDFAKRNQLLPAGTWLEKTTLGWGGLRIELVQGQHPNARSAGNMPRVPMPAELRSLHPVVMAIQQDRGRLAMHSSLRERALRYFHGLTGEAVRRNYTIQMLPIAQKHRNRITTYGRPGVPDYSRREGELGIVVNGFSFTVKIDQPHPEADDLERFNQLAVFIYGHYHSRGQRYRWADGKRASIDTSIAAVLYELEARAARAAQRQATRQQAWQEAMDQATHQATQAYYAGALTKQTTAWRQAGELALYCDALEKRILEAEQAGLDVSEAQRWLQWAREYIISLDPLQSVPSMPTLELTPDDIQPYLDGWSAHGAEQSWRVILT